MLNRSQIDTLIEIENQLDAIALRIARINNTIETPENGYTRDEQILICAERSVKEAGTRLHQLTSHRFL